MVLSPLVQGRGLKHPWRLPRCNLPENALVSPNCWSKSDPSPKRELAGIVSQCIDTPEYLGDTPEYLGDALEYLGDTPEYLGDTLE